MKIMFKADCDLNHQSGVEMHQMENQQLVVFLSLVTVGELLVGIVENTEQLLHPVARQNIKEHARL